MFACLSRLATPKMKLNFGFECGMQPIMVSLSLSKQSPQLSGGGSQPVYSSAATVVVVRPLPVIIAVVVLPLANCE